jgi:LAS superfamily LD-carboxypeptidase LdcB
LAAALAKPKKPICAWALGLFLVTAGCDKAPWSKMASTPEPSFPPAAKSASKAASPAPRSTTPSLASTEDDLGPTRIVVGYRQGKPVDLRVVKQDGEWVEPETARAYRSMQEAARRDGVTLRITSGFRTQEEQAKLYRCWQRNRCPLAARPGYSHHQSGLALDLDVRTSRKASAWLEKHAPHFGFRHTVRGEPWHWEFSQR